MPDHAPGEARSKEMLSYNATNLVARPSMQGEEVHAVLAALIPKNSGHAYLSPASAVLTKQHVQ